MAETETFAFHPKINNLISLNNNHPDKNIFLIQLISFTIDALDKIRFESLTDKSKLDAQPELFIRIIPDKANNTLTIVDSGIGMTKADLVNLCVVRRSARDNVRFFTTYLVAKKVIVTTKHNDDEQYVWESQGDGYFTVTRDTSGENLGRGTKITLFLKQDHLQFLEESRLKKLIKKHYRFINYPVSLWIEKATEKEISDDEEGKVDVVDEEEEKEEEEKKRIHEMSHEWLLVNEMELIWKQEFAFKEFSVNGSLEIKATIFVPKKPTFYMRKKIHLVVDGVLITDNYNKELIPEYLDFFGGLVYVYLHDRPLDIFTEMFQQDKIVTVIRKNLVEKSFELLYEIAEIKEDYNKLYEAFSGRLKLGIFNDHINQIKIAELLRYHSTKSGDEMTSLMEYVTRMKEGQNDIYYIIGESKKAVENSPFLEKLKKEGYEVLFMVDKLDKFVVVDGLKEFEGKKFVSATKEGLKLDESEDEEKRKDELKERFDGLCKLMKDVLGDEVEDVVVPDRYVHSPCCIVTSENGISGKKIMKINSMDPIMEGLMNRLEADKNDKSAKDLISLLYYNADFTSLSEKMAGNFIQHD